jgi:hypothetical protein
VSREEEAILWRALERIPDVYREPMILFYREDKSVERVASELELSEDAVKQRLSRGPKLLHEEVAAFVEGTLSRTAPREEFSRAVLAMLPAAPVATVGVSAAGKGAAMVKSGWMALWLAPFIGVFAAIMVNWLSVRDAPTARERRFQTSAYIGLWTFSLVWAVAGQFAMQALSQHFSWSAPIFYASMTGFWWIYAIFVATFTVLFLRRVVAMRRQGEEMGETCYAKTPTLGSSLGTIAGLHVALFSWLIWLAWRAHDQVTAGIVTVIMLVLGIWQFIDVHGKSERDAFRGTVGHLALGWGIVLAIFNLRLDVWLAAFRGTDVAGIHRLLPLWALPLATLTVLVWTGALVAMTKPARAA